MSIEVHHALGLTAAELAQIDALGQRLGDDGEYRNRLSLLKSAIEEQQTRTIAEVLAAGMAAYGPVSPLLMIVQSLPVVRALYRRCGIADAVRDATLADVRRWIDEHAVRNGAEFGLSQVFWIARHLSCRILQLGSLQYEQRRFGYPYRIYRSSETALLLVVAESGIPCDGEGYFDEQRPAFVTSLMEDGTTLSAHVVDLAAGRISSARQSFRLERMELLCHRQSEILNVHIPKGSDLAARAVDASLAAAAEYFSLCSVFVCTSWLLDPALAGLLEEGSNIVGFMHRFSKFPVPFSVPQLYERVFGFGLAEKEVRSYSARTRLQRAVQRALDSGVVFRTMGGFVLVRGA